MKAGDPRSELDLALKRARAVRPLSGVLRTRSAGSFRSRL